ncbi:acetylglucosaminyldiphospho-UDP acetyl-beta-D-mannosaminyltransferase [Candidatus Peregrinibacteria bacterium CG11_big_fil_rev_8_21_14_0_20_41_10]|nr:MAG: acetylglucosaminyldiphospho-UDP acetyl-beta-D-mannosaminyltransferase [Candidatus Peregrinibacteria bacterium CG11_big_fil_rev_8_21_14_0_20_41_10]PJC38050.1 MAG: acetylglucosaminyldiphospho-UDP acetyl-beta-D-mannosaminyltransferase [Candidatus Peregrinibacteria bacterium CG_4_9_14_0_2_um_filter_41_14]
MFINMETKTVLGVEFLDEGMPEAVAFVAGLVDKPNKTQIVTPNPEIFLIMWAMADFKELVLQAELKLADGFGIEWASWFEQTAAKWPMWKRKLLVYPSVVWCAIKRPKAMVKRVTGTGLMEQLLVWNPDISYFLLGAAPGVAEQVVKKFPYANIVGTYAGNPAAQFEDDIVEQINNSDAKVLFVAYGAPNQEFWIKRNLHKFKHVRVAVGVGGAFDYLAGEVARAPLFWQKVGLEWFYRLFKQPSRLKRILRAVVVFPWRVLAVTTTLDLP